MFDEKQFPVEVFPDEVQRIIGDTHRFLNFDRSFIGSSLLAVASVAVGNSISLEVKREWTDKAIMYMALVGKASSNKSAPLKFAMSALQSRDGREYSKFDKEYDKYDESQRKSGKGNLGPLPEPKFNQTILKDFTPEILIKQHIANPRGLVVYKDELMGFIKDFNKYRNGNDEQIWTELYNGGEMVVNRMNNRPLRIDETFIGIAGTIQPGMLPEFAKGRIESGFIDRWLFAFAEKEGFPEFTDDEIENEVKQSWFRIVDRILSIPLDEKHRVIRMTDEAKKTYKEWFNALARLKNNPKFLLPEMATKMERYCLRFSIVLEALKYGCGQERIDAIQTDSIKGAIDLCTYYLSCAFKVRRLFRRLPVESMSELQKAIYQELPESFSTAEAIKIAVQYGMKERTLKDWLKTDLFIRLYHGQYQRRYSQ